MEYDSRLLHRNIAFPLLKKLLNSGDLTAKKAFKKEMIKRLLARNEIITTYLLEEGYLESINYEERKILAIELLESGNLNVIEFLWNKGFFVHLGHEMVFFAISNALKNETKKRKLISALLYLVSTQNLRRNERSRAIFQAIAESLNQQEIPWIVDKIVKHTILLKELIRIQIFSLFNNDYCNIVILNLLIEFLKGDNSGFNFINKGKPNFLSLLRSIKFLITVENLEERKIIREEIVKRLCGDDIELIADLIQSAYFFEYLTIDDIKDIFNDSEINFERKLLRILEIREKIEWEILKLYLLINVNSAFDILYYFLYDILIDSDSRLNRKFFNKEPLFQNLKRNLVSEVKKVAEIQKIPNIVIDHIFEKLKAEKKRYPIEFTFKLLNPAYVSIAPKGIKELLESLDTRIYQNLQWEYDDDIIIPILNSVRNLYPEDFRKGLFWLIEKYGIDYEHFSYHHTNFINELNRESFWKLIGPDKQVLIDIEREINQKLCIYNNNDYPRNSGFIIKNRNVQMLSIWEVYLQQLPETIGDFKDLKELYINNTPLYSLPVSIKNLTSLKKLHITYAHLSSLPDSFKDLDSLEELDLSNNDFSAIPDVIGKLKSLKILHLGENPIKFLPESLGELKFLTKLDLYYFPSHEFVPKIPDSLLKCESLNYLIINKQVSNENQEIIKLLRRKGVGVEEW